MNKYPKFAQVGNRKYTINTDFEVALECNEIAQDNTISDEERAIAIIYKLFGNEGLDNCEDWEQLLQIAMKYLNCNKDTIQTENDDEPNMDIKQDWSYIKSSFFYDYNINLDEVKMHYWEFFDLLCGLSEKCVLNRVRFIRDYDTSQIKDSKELEKWQKQKELVALNKIENKKTPEEVRLDELFERQLRGE